MQAKTEELEQIVYVTSHDLRSPLVNIQGFTSETRRSLDEIRSVLEREDLPPAARDALTAIIQREMPEALGHIVASANRMDSLLSGLLRLSRVDGAPLEVEELDMAWLVSGVVPAFALRIREAGALVEVGELPPCRGDRSQVDQVFTNLIGNALQYLDPARNGIIKVSGTRNDGQVTYSVTDNGVGIAPEYHEKVFDLFHRLDPGAGSGEGLGLAIVRRIVKRHGGEVWVESEPGKGSTFFVSLPAPRIR